MTKRLFLIISAALVGVVPGSLSAQGRLGLLPQGEYVCATPGSAVGAAWVEDPARHFTVTGASSYRAQGGSGTYLLEGRSLRFTRGPMKGMAMMVMNSGLLQEVGVDGRLGRLRCHRSRASD